VLNHLIPADDAAIGEADWIAAVRKTWAGDLTIARDGLVVGLEHDPEKWDPVFGKDQATDKDQSGEQAAQGEETA
ncbi:MAG: hypothetical protein EOS47_26130, partial [Mesorhizobium sp.]